ncbi:MAG: hypothetical protein ACK468_13320 [Dolichospermum sp.]
MKVSAPALPVRVSFPKPPVRMLAAALPVMLLFSSLPVPLIAVVPSKVSCSLFVVRVYVKVVKTISDP